MAAALCAPGVLALTAHDDGELVGVAELLTDGAVVAYLGLLLVSRQARRRGVGRSLIGELFARSGLSRIDLLSEIDGARQQRRSRGDAAASSKGIGRSPSGRPPVGS